jgi:hypothetical protein
MSWQATGHTQMEYVRTVVAGQDVFDEVSRLRAIAAEINPRYGRNYDPEWLPRHQIAMSGRGYIEAEIVKSMYGYTLRYASGLQDFGLIWSRGRGGPFVDNFAQCVEKAREWQAEGPKRRYVTYMTLKTD